MFEYCGTLVRVVDGDTVDCDVDLGFRIYHRARLRLAGIDAPEIRTREARDHPDNVAITARCHALLSKGPLEILVLEKDKYGRYVAVIFNADGVHVNDELLQMKGVKPYPAP